METYQTPFTRIYDIFLGMTTDDTYLELTELDTYRLLQDLLLSAIPHFEFPRFDITNYELTEGYDIDFYCGEESDNEEVEVVLYEGGFFNSVLTMEEMQILAQLMYIEWISQQILTCDNTRLKYSGSDFKFTSQANHLNKLKDLRKEYERIAFQTQRLYKRRKKDELTGIYKSTLSALAENSVEW